MLSRIKKEIPFERSFAYTPYAYLWSETNELKATQIYKSS